MVFDLYAQGKTISQIIRLLNERGLRTLRGRPFTNNSLRSMLKNEKYIGVYTYKDEIRLEGAIPPIVEPEVFHKVQEMLRYNQKAAAHKNAKADYLLTEKLFCGKCGQMMVGVSGTSHTGTRHHYYYCTEQRKKKCTKKPVRKVWIEGLVLEYVTALIQNEDLLEFIAEKTYQYYLAQNTESAYTESLQKALDEVEKATTNLVRALEAGIFNEATKRRMEELDEQKAELQSALAAAKLRSDLGLKKGHILYFLHKFAEMDVTDEDCQKQMIKIFVNSVFVYDDKVVITFNYSRDDRTITLHEIDAGLQQGVRLPRSLCHHRPSSLETRDGGFCYFYALLQQAAAPVLTADNLVHLFRCFPAPAGQPHFDDCVKPLLEKLDMIINMLVIKMLLRLVDVIITNLILVVIAQLKIGAVKQLIVADVIKQLEIIIAVKPLDPLLLVQVADLVLKVLAHFVSQVINIDKIRVKRAAVQPAELADIGYFNVMQLFFLQKLGKRLFNASDRLAPAAVIFCVHAVPFFIIPTDVLKLMIVFLSHTHYTGLK